ncbi:MAG: Gfo/Idh/MocA family oxidoreductase [Spirochaetia bacterium]
MSKPAIRLGVIGISLRNMASTLTLLPGEPGLRYVITASCALGAAEVEACARAFGIPFWTDDYRALVRRQDVDVVCVFSPDHLHAEHCTAALQQGKHVVCTKPMVTRLEDARQLVALVRERKVKLLVGQTMRFDRQFLAAKKLFDEGGLGTPIALESAYVHDMRPVYESTPWRRTVPQDLMFGGCVHCIDVLRAFGGEIESVHGFANQGGLTEGYPIQDNFFLNIRFASGAIGRVSGLYGIVHPPLPMMQFGIFGTRGSLQAEFTDNQPGQIRVTRDGVPMPGPEMMRFEPERDLSAYGHGAAVIRYMRHFQECLDTGIEPSPGVIDGAKSVAVGVAAWESIRTGLVAHPADVGGAS